MRHRRVLLPLAAALTAVALLGGGTSSLHAAAAGPAQPGGVVLDKFGGLHGFGGAAVDTSNAPYWPGWNIARSVVVLADGSGGWTLDGWGGIHQWGAAPAIATPFYWKGWDIARALVVLPDEQSGYLLDGFGTVHAFGAAPPLAITSWPGWDVARGLDVRLDGNNSVVGAALLDAFGGVHTTGTYYTYNPAVYSGSYVYHALHNVADYSYSVSEFGVVSLFDGGLQPYWSGFPDWGAWDITQDVALLRADNPAPTSQPLSAWAWNGFLRAARQPYDVGYVPACDVGSGARSAAAQVIVVSIECQELSAYQGGQFVQGTPVTTARPGDVTPRGWHHILSKLSPISLLLNVTYGPVVHARYGMAFDTIGDIFHDAPWEPTAAYGLPSSLQPPYGSHGCVHVPVDALGVLYGRTRIGASVYIN